MKAFEKLLESYFQLPYRPEFLVKKVREELKDYKFTLAVESSNKILQKNYHHIFKNIFGTKGREYKFNRKVVEPKSIENFRNFVYENCKLNYDDIKKKEILLYLFQIEIFNDSIIDAIYKANIFKNNDKDKDIYTKLFENYLNNKYYDRDKFDQIYLPKWIDDKKQNFIKGSYNKDLLFSPENIELNYLIYNYYGPYETKFNFILNKKDKFKKKVTLFSPDFLIENKILEEYSEENFQVFNQNNSCPGLFIFLMKKALKGLNDQIKGKEMNDDSISDIGIIKFKDNTTGLYLKCSKLFTIL